VRGDGNCYYRSVAYGYIEHLTLSGRDNCLTDLIKLVNSEDSLYSMPDDSWEIKNYKKEIT
jgi:hypothetical protein